MAVQKRVLVTLTPGWEGDRPVDMRVEMCVKDCGVQQGGCLLSLYKRTANRLFNKLLVPIHLSDAAGELPCEEKESVVATHILKQDLMAKRPAEGDLHISYTVAIEEGQPNPIFDLGSEPGGAMGSGMTFLPGLPYDKIAVCLHWDLSALPEGCTGVWTYGRGDSEAVIDGTGLQTSVYTLGRLEWVEQDGFGFYWVRNPQLKGREIGEWMGELFTKMSAFFEDQGGCYRIVTRRKKEMGEISSGSRFGGTALTRSYMWLYDEKNPPEVRDLRHLFPHETVHNWLTLGRDDEPFGTSTWYAEGTAEYYSALLPYRYGMISRAELLDLLNERCDRYYKNPYRNKSNLECGALLMKDRDATRIPYGRGFFYLTAVDEQIREATGGQKCLDDVVLDILRRQRAGETCDNETWLRLTGELAGRDMRPDFESMAMGGPVVPHAQCFGDDIRVIPVTVQTEDGQIPSYRYE